MFRLRRGRRIRVATWNIRHGRGIDGVVDLERIAATMRSFEADVVGLQEVDRGWARSGGTDQPALLEDLTGMAVAFTPTIAESGRAYGLGIATDRPVATDVEPLPTGAGEEPRAVLVARAAGTTVLVTHLSRRADTRAHQIERLAELATSVAPPVVLLGDLNEGRGGLGILRRAGLSGPRRRVRTVPAHRPLRQIDHVLAGRGAAVENVWAGASRASDHRPLVAVVRVAEDNY